MNITNTTVLYNLHGEYLLKTIDVYNANTCTNTLELLIGNNIIVVWKLSYCNQAGLYWRSTRWTAKLYPLSPQTNIRGCCWVCIIIWSVSLTVNYRYFCKVLCFVYHIVQRSVAQYTRLLSVHYDDVCALPKDADYR